MHNSNNTFGRKIRINRILLFITGLIIINQICNLIYTEVVLSQSLLYQGEEQFQQVKQDVTILVMGDSHTEYSVNPTYMESAFNFSSSGEHYIQSFYKLRYYLEGEGLNFKTVVLPLDMHSFSGYRTDEIINNDYWRKYVDYFELAQEKEEFWTVISFRLEGELAYWHGADETKNFLSKKGKKLNGGFLTKKKSIRKKKPQKIVNLAKSRVRSHLGKEIYFNEVLLKYFKRLLELVKKHEINVVFIRYPVTREYFQAAKKYIPEEQYYSNLKAIIEDYFQNPAILDYHDLYWDQLNFFNDVDHLNMYGAEDFSPILWQDLIDLGVTP